MSALLKKKYTIALDRLGSQSCDIFFLLICGNNFTKKKQIQEVWSKTKEIDEISKEEHYILPKAIIQPEKLYLTG